MSSTCILKAKRNCGSKNYSVLDYYSIRPLLNLLIGKLIFSSSILFSDIESLEKQYHAGTLSATKMLDQACHFFDGWTVTTLEDSWNEEYGQYIMQIDNPRTVQDLDDINRGLLDIEIPEEQPPPLPPALAAAAAVAAPAARTFNACAVCYGELNHDNWYIMKPCWHCFCERCVKDEIHPDQGPNESFVDHFMRLRPCPTCRGDIEDAFKIFPNYVTITDADLVIPVVHADAEGAAVAADAPAADAAAVDAAGEEVEAEIAAEAAAERVLENQRIVSDLMYSER